MRLVGSSGALRRWGMVCVVGVSLVCIMLMLSVALSVVRDTHGDSFDASPVGEHYSPRLTPAAMEFGRLSEPRDAIQQGPHLTWSEFVKEQEDVRRRYAPEASSPADGVETDRMLRVDYLMYPNVSANLLPLLRVPTLFRTAVIRDKPRHCFLPTPPINDGSIVGDQRRAPNVSRIIASVQAIAAVSPERVPIAPFCHEDYIANYGEQPPKGGPHAVYDVGFVFDGERCSTNMWHGMLEVVVPIFGAKALVALETLGYDLSKIAAGTTEARQLRQSLLTPELADRVVKQLVFEQQHLQHVLLMRAPRKNIWGVHNLGCPMLNHYPYGWSTTTVSGWFLFSLFEPVTFSPSMWPLPKRLPQKPGEKIGDPQNILFFGETPTTNKKYEMRYFGQSRTISVKKSLFYGPSGLCKWSKAFDMPPRNVEPFYLTGDALCPWVYDVTKRYALAMANMSEVPVSLESMRCPKIGVVVRRSFHNGRGIRNFDTLISALRRHVAGGGPELDVAGGEGGAQRLFDEQCGTVDVINIEADVPFGQQIRLMNDLDVVIGARGMGLTNALFMKRYAGLLVLSGREVMAGLNIPGDNYPWHPLHALRPWNPTVLSSCPVVFPSPSFIKKANAAAAEQPNSTRATEISTYAKRCITRSVNFCDMRCSIAKVIQDFDRVLFMMRSALLSDTAGNGTAMPQPLRWRDAAFIADKW